MKNALSLLLFAFVPGLFACATTAPPRTATTPAATATISTIPTPPPASHIDLGQLYDRALEDALVADPGEVSTKLVAILEATPGLSWKGQGTNRKVLTVTWTSWDGYDGKTGQPSTIPDKVYPFVTAAPQVRDFCHGIEKGDGLSLRLEQYLGLPAHVGKTKFVELWVDPNDLFRPCADPEITDHECEAGARNNPFESVNPAHKQWFTEFRAASDQAKKYPFTGLGYTYDWAVPGQPVGASEFVIRSGAKVEIGAVRTTEEYCR